MRKHLIIATRGSQLALWQAEHVKALLEALDSQLRVSLNVIKTRGDIIQDVPLSKVGGKGLFVKEIEEALLDGRADLAVHSIKDVPMQLPEGLILGCIPPRETPTDCLLSMAYPDLDALPQGAHVGTSSLRRQAQLLAIRPDLRISSLRGNVDTRLRKLAQGDYDAIILASAGMKRLGLSAPYMSPLDVDAFLPAVGQGAIGIECREDNYDLLVLLASLEDRDTRVCVEAERAFLARLEGGCQVPIAGHARLVDDETISLQGLVAEVDGSRILRGRMEAHATEAGTLGQNLAADLLQQGGRAILEKLYQEH
ncbi:MAG: hydroxymethylbilane synthase [Desulfovibrionaceae bacterium]|nr:hydroxymethylbilane synthase [Desulfovibrionaceae bacterium]